MKVYERYELKSSFGNTFEKELKFITENAIISTAKNELNYIELKQNIHKKQVFEHEISTVLVGNHVTVGDGDLHFEEGSTVCVGSQVYFKDSIFTGHKSVIQNAIGSDDLLFTADAGLIIGWDLLQERGLYKHSVNGVCQMLMVEKYLIYATNDFIKVWDYKQDLVLESLSLGGGIQSIAVLPSAAEDESGKELISILLCGENKVDVVTLNLTIVNHKANSLYLSLTQEQIDNPDLNKDDIVLPKTKSAFGTPTTLYQSPKPLKQMKVDQNLVFVLSDHLLSILKFKKSKLSLQHQIQSVKIKTFDIFTQKSQIKIALGLRSNQIEIFNYNTQEKSSVLKKSFTEGHQSEVRNICLNKANDLILSQSQNEVKMWMVDSEKLLNTYSFDEPGTNLVWLPGEEYFVLACKTGSLDLYDIGSGNVLESVAAHKGSVWGLTVHENMVISGGEDGNVLIFNLDMVLDPEYSNIKKRPTLVHMKTLKLNQDVLCVKVSPDGKFLVVSLLDLTVKVFYLDTLKFALSLYGHKLPVLTMDISYDSKLLITGSSDKTIKIWGLKFGDLQKSLLKHQDAILKVQFVWGTYCFFTTSKDGSVMYWDGETNENLDVFKKHFGKVGALAIAKYGNFIVTGSSDRSIKVWEKTSNQYVAQEQRELEMEQMYAEAEESNQPDQQKIIERQTQDSLKEYEVLSEALDLYENEVEQVKKYHQLKDKMDLQPPPRDAFWQKYTSKGVLDLSSSGCVFLVMKQVRSSNWSALLLNLEFKRVKILISVLNDLLSTGFKENLVFRVVIELVRLFGDELVADGTMKKELVSISATLKKGLKDEKLDIGYNIKGMEYLRREIEVEYPSDEKEDESSKRKRLVIES